MEAGGSHRAGTMAARSPLSVETAQRILDYDRAVFGRFERRIRRLPRREAVADRGTGHLSFLGTLVHILNVRDAWFNFVIRDRTRSADAFFDRDERHPADWKGFDAYAPEVWAGHERLGSSLTARSIGTKAKAPWMRGQYTVGDAILQVSYEQAHHLGEIIGALWVLDKPSPDMTWIEVNRDELGRLGRRD